MHACIAYETGRNLEIAKGISPAAAVKAFQGNHTVYFTSHYVFDYTLCHCAAEDWQQAFNVINALIRIINVNTSCYYAAADSLRSIHLIYRL